MKKTLLLICFLTSFLSFSKDKDLFHNLLFELNDRSITISKKDQSLKWPKKIFIYVSSSSHMLGLDSDLPITRRRATTVYSFVSPNESQNSFNISMRAGELPKLGDDYFYYYSFTNNYNFSEKIEESDCLKKYKKVFPSIGLSHTVEPLEISENIVLTISNMTDPLFPNKKQIKKDFQIYVKKSNINFSSYNLEKKNISNKGYISINIRDFDSKIPLKNQIYVKYEVNKTRSEEFDKEFEKQISFLNLYNSKCLNRTFSYQEMKLLSNIYEEKNRLKNNYVESYSSEFKEFTDSGELFFSFLFQNDFDATIELKTANREPVEISIKGNSNDSSHSYTIDWPQIPLNIKTVTKNTQPIIIKN